MYVHIPQQGCSRRTHETDETEKETPIMLF